MANHRAGDGQGPARGQRGRRGEGRGGHPSRSRAPETRNRGEGFDGEPRRDGAVCDGHRENGNRGTRGSHRSQRARGIRCRGKGRGHHVDGTDREFIISDRFLQELKEESPRNIILEVSSKLDSFNGLLNSGQIDRDSLRLILGILAKGCDSRMNQKLSDVLGCVLHSRFFEYRLKVYLATLTHDECKEYVKNEEIGTDIHHITTLIGEMVLRFPSQAVDISLLDKLKVTVDKLQETGCRFPDGLRDQVDELVRTRDDCIVKAAARQHEKVLPLAMSLEEPPDEFRAVDIVPSSQEVAKNEKPFLRSNIVDGSFKDLDQYLDIQFRLLREDLVGPLREGINISTLPGDDPRRKKGKQHDLRLYHNARVGQPVCTLSGLTHKVQFDTSCLRRVNWSHSRRLIYGSLLCFSNDHFKNIKLATVANRKPQDLAKGLVEVRFMNGLEDAHDMTGQQIFTIAESPAYFEAYRHVLRRLQHVGPDLPLQTYIVQCKRDEMKAPRYLRPEYRDGEDARMDLRNALGCTDARARDLKVMDWDAWPLCEHVNLDESQLVAIKAALTREFALIQGPPGTGKTFIGLKVMRALIDNRGIWDPAGNSPILVVCYTNHALDQFLEGILQFHRTGIVRVGGRSESEALKELNLNALTKRLRQDKEVPGTIFRNQKRLRYELYDMKDTMEETVKELNRQGTINVKSIGDLPDCVKASELRDRGGYHRIRGYSLLDEWLGIVCNDSVKGQPNHADNTSDVPSGDDDEQQQGDDSDSTINAEADDEAEILEAQRRLDGGEFERIEDTEDPDHNENEPVIEREIDDAAVEAAGYQPVDQRQAEDDGWRIVTMNKARRNQKIRDGLSRAPMTEEEAAAVDDIWDLTEINRWRLYNYWLQKRRDYLQQIIDELCTEFEEATEQLLETNEEESLHVLQGATVIGMTTTGAAKHHGLLLKVKPKIIVVEEAAEVYEAHIVTTLSASVEHLILIGDHQQLRPSPHVYRLAKEYKLDVSLFERMINNDMPCHRLNVQHRMRPEIAELMAPIYDGLLNHESVASYENIAGVKHNMFFIEHSQREEKNEDLRSHLNVHEARFVAAFCRYLMQQGIPASKITVLTTYSGQVLTLKKVMPKVSFQGVRITAVDNYQGEENDVIILSLVRSNEEGKIGFLSTPNRVCVALSRAKKGFYCVGDMKLLSRKSNLWRKIVKDTRKSGIVGPAVELRCQNHPGTAFKASDASDFKNAPEGGCTRRCEFRLDCGHVCALTCHPYDREHTQYKCCKPCPKIRCELGHQCQRKCFQDCGECLVEVDKVMPSCGHTQTMKCHVNPLQYPCKADCPKLLVCGHQCGKKCGDKDCTTQCYKVVSKTWPCGHTDNVYCWEQETRICLEPCTDMLDCDHQCAGTCGECLQGRLHKACQSNCGRTLVCSHSCNYPCTKNCPACDRPCENACSHSACQRKCGELCEPYREPCEWECEHFMCGNLCGELCDRQRCDEPCQRVLECSHQCIGLCGESCPEECRHCHEETVTEIFFGSEDDPDAKFVKLEDCGHIFEVTGLDRWMDSEQEDDDGRVHIGLKLCPRCNVAVRRSLRYGNIVKRALQDIDTVKRKMLEEERKLKSTVKQLKKQAVELTEILKNSSLFETLFSGGDQRRREYLRLGIGNPYDIDDITVGDKSPSGTILKRLRRRLTAEEVRTIQNQIQFLPSVVELADKIEKAPAQNDNSLQRKCQKMLSDLDGLVSFLMKSELTDQELEDFQLQMDKMEVELNFRILMKKLQPRLKDITKDHMRYVDLVEEGLADRPRRTRADVEVLKRTVRFLSKTYGAYGITEAEKHEIVHAVGLSRGHWYKCPNGHPYAIADCGGAMEKSTCPECHVVIGGERHRLADGNLHAPEMDGSNQPAWPT